VRGDAFNVASVVKIAAVITLTIIIIISAFILGLAWNTIPPPGWPLAMCGVVGICVPLTVLTLWGFTRSLKFSVADIVVDAVVNAVDDAITRAFNSRLQIVGAQLTEKHTNENALVMQAIRNLADELDLVQKTDERIENASRRIEKALTATVALFTGIIDDGDDPRTPAPN
jgi:hypothetical protein